MSRGVVAGKVIDTNGIPVSKAVVELLRIHGGQGLFDVEIIRDVYTNSEGKFAMPFSWKASDLALDPSVIWIEVLVYSESNTSTSSIMTARKKNLVRGIITTDLIGLAERHMSNFSSIPEIADFAIDIAKVLASWNRLVPFWKIDKYLSTNQQILVGCDNFFLENF
ncbi:MAG: carboxypeptidase-like regulatory domain-containing protein [Acidobacteriota bacterium]|nr:carboxypeptidase-like regulatory domain-containing protein [Acidobacteriota bacterium]